MTADETTALELAGLFRPHVSDPAIQDWIRATVARVNDEREAALSAYILETCGTMALAEALRDHGWKLLVTEDEEWDTTDPSKAVLRMRFGFKWVPPEDNEELDPDLRPMV